jgi:hypothetical protein
MFRRRKRTAEPAQRRPSTGAGNMIITTKRGDPWGSFGFWIATLEAEQRWMSAGDKQLDAITNVLDLRQRELDHERQLHTGQAL